METFSDWEKVMILITHYLSILDLFYTGKTTYSPYNGIYLKYIRVLFLKCANSESNTASYTKWSLQEMVFRVMKVFAKKTDSLKWFITSVLIKVKKATVWLPPAPKFYCSISRLGGSAFELLLQKLSYWYCSAALCAEHEWNCWNAKGVLLPNHKGFPKSGDQHVSFNFSLLIPGNPISIKIGATKEWGKVLKKKNSLRWLDLSGIQVCFF